MGIEKGLGILRMCQTKEQSEQRKIRREHKRADDQFNIQLQIFNFN